EREKWFSSGIFCSEIRPERKNGFQAVFFAPKYGLREKNGFQAVLLRSEIRPEREKVFSSGKKKRRAQPGACMLFS
ncbi:MAG: hypothetical protein II444_06195, partial [Firmicutes bacterium]|nr:hypothetical protein [Bacillota bacterium]